MVQKRVIFFKKKDTDDEYHKLFTVNNFITEFIPVLSHKLENTQDLSNILLDGPKVQQLAGLILTSRRSVEAIKEAYKDITEIINKDIVQQWNQLAVYIVGPQTASLLAQIPLFSNTNSIPSHWLIAPRAAELIEPLVAKPQLNSEKLLFLAGDKRRDLIPTELKKENIRFRELQTYATCVHPDLDQSMWDRSLENVDWVVYFSPSGIKFLGTTINDKARSELLPISANRCHHIKVAAIGPTTADYITDDLGLQVNAAADKPDAQHLLDAILNFEHK